MEFLINEFGEEFPATRKFSAVARELSDSSSDPVSKPDEVLVEWMSEEEHLFKLFERKRVTDQLKAGFGESGDDVDQFISFSLSVQNRENQGRDMLLRTTWSVFLRNKVEFVRSGRTEGKKKPDFFDAFKWKLMPTLRFQMKSYLSWVLRQRVKIGGDRYFPEAERVKQKHLITLQPAISDDN